MFFVQSSILPPTPPNGVSPESPFYGGHFKPPFVHPKLLSIISERMAIFCKKKISEQIYDI